MNFSLHSEMVAATLLLEPTKNIYHKVEDNLIITLRDFSP